MALPKARSLARAPLFDRLVDGEPDASQERTPFRTLDREGLTASVVREVERVVNSRTPLPAAVVVERQRSVLDYGIPDLAYFRPNDFGSEGELARFLAETIAAFEPRLRDVMVDVAEMSRERNTMTAVVRAILVAGEIAEPLSFAVAVGGGGGEAEVET